MAKKIISAVVAGGILANTLGAIPVNAYSGETAYPENKKVALVITAVDVRNSRFSAYFYNTNTSIFKGMRVFGGEIDDATMNKITESTTRARNEYYRYDLRMSTWEEGTVSNGVEMTFDTTVDLASNVANTLGFYYLLWISPTNKNLNIRRGRMNYDRCASSEVYLENVEAICRAEIWADGMLHYQPYIDWTRLDLPDDPEQDFVQVYKNNSWISERIREEVLPEPEPEPESEPELELEPGLPEPADDEIKRGGVVEDEESIRGDGGGESSETSGGENIKIIEVVKEVEKEVPIEKIVEVPIVEKVEVPIEKIVEVPVEKRVVEIKEVVREIPVFASLLAEKSAQAAGSSEVETEAKNEFKLSTEQEEPMMPDDIEIPELGREIKDELWNSKVAVFSAGVVSALSLLILTVVFKKKKQKWSR